MDAAGPPRRISSVRLESIRKLTEFRLSFDRTTPTGGGVCLVIGKNGTCKSTLLRAIAVGLTGSHDASALLAQPLGTLVGHNAKRGSIEIELIGLEPGTKPASIRREIESANGKNVLVSSEPDDISQGLGVFACGYGAARGITGTDTGRTYRILDSVYGLFDYSQRLIEPELTLRRLQDYLGMDRYRSTMAGIKRVLDLGLEDEIRLGKGGGVEITGPSVGTTVRLDEWADGYRLTFNWLLDFYAWAMRADRVHDDGTVTGILLIDELDQHLHPALQASVIPRLRSTLPGVQIIATTHSPLIALGCDPGDLVVLRSRGDQVVRESQVPDYSGYSAADMLEDDRLFDSDIYSPDTQRDLARYQELVRMGPEKRDDTDEEELKKIVGRLKHQPLPQRLDESLIEALKAVEKRLGLKAGSQGSGQEEV